MFVYFKTFFFCGNNYLEVGASATNLERGILGRGTKHQSEYTSSQCLPQDLPVLRNSPKNGKPYTLTC